MEIVTGILGIVFAGAIYYCAFLGARHLWRQRKLAPVAVSTKSAATPVNVEED